MLHLLKKTFLFASLISATTALAASFSGLVGVDYQPNHYPNGNLLNFHDVFYVSNNAAGKAITNVYAELSQLKAAGFTTVRSYQTTDYSWVDIINQANALGMKVIYEAVIPQQPADSTYLGGCPNPPAVQNYIPCAQTVLNSVINTVGAQVFQNTVILVFAGHENYCQAGNITAPCNNPTTSNISYLTSAVSALQSTLTAAGLTTPVGSALVSGNLTTPSSAISQDMVTLINSYSATAPIAFDPYPFQWGVPPASAVWIQPLTTTQLNNSLAWDYLSVVGSTNPPANPTAATQPFYTPLGRTLLSAETGWATQGSTSIYACNSPGPCAPSVANAVSYYQALYQQSNANNFVASSGYPIGVLAFEAYDEPTKGISSAEGNYGLFDSNCNQKAAGLVPNNIMVSETGCQGFSGGALLTIVGFGNPYTLVITQTNPVTGKSANITMPGTGNQGPLADAPWPEYLVFPGAKITIRGNPSCTSTVQAINGAQQITFSGTCNCPNNNSNNCFF